MTKEEALQLLKEYYQYKNKESKHYVKGSGGIPLPGYRQRAETIVNSIYKEQ